MRMLSRGLQPPSTRRVGSAANRSWFSPCEGTTPAIFGGVRKVCTRVVVKVDGMVGQNGTSHLRLLAAVIIECRCGCKLCLTVVVLEEAIIFRPYASRGRPFCHHESTCVDPQNRCGSCRIRTPGEDRC